MTPSLSSKGASIASIDTKALTPTPSVACTAACTSNPENDNAGRVPSGCDADPAGHQGQGEGTTAKPAVASLESLADALLALSPADRARLAAMLKGTHDA